MTSRFLTSDNWVKKGTVIHQDRAYRISIMNSAFGHVEFEMPIQIMQLAIENTTLEFETGSCRTHECL